MHLILLKIRTWKKMFQCHTQLVEIFYLKTIKPKDTLCIFMYMCCGYSFHSCVYKVFLYKTRLSNWKHQGNNSPFLHKISQQHSEVLCWEVIVWFPTGLTYLWESQYLWERHWANFLFQHHDQRKDSSLKICVHTWRQGRGRRWNVRPWWSLSCKNNGLLKLETSP